jgi:WD40 repeat protein
VDAVAVITDGRQAVSGSGELKVWDLEGGELITTVALGEGVLSVATSPDGVTIIAGDGVGNVYCLRYVDPKANGCGILPGSVR